jgi:hypothetical protein
VLYRPTKRADAALQALCEGARTGGSRLTVLVLVAEERASSRCCDTRSVLWNEICRDLARGADEIVLADPTASGLGPLERRRLRRRSPVPVSV